MRAERRVAEAALEAARAHERAKQGGAGARLDAQIESLGDGSEAEAARDDAERRAEQANAAMAESEQLRAPRRRRHGPRPPSVATRARKPAGIGARGAVARRSPSMTRWPARWSRAAARRSPRLRPSPATSARWPRRWARIPTPRSAATAPRRWEGSEGAASDPALAARPRMPRRSCSRSCASLGRRLRQVGVVDDDQGEVLAVGQRLVTRDGRAAPLGRLCRDLERRRPRPSG